MLSLVRFPSVSTRPFSSRLAAAVAAWAVALFAVAAPAAAQPVFSKSFSPATIGEGSTTALTFAIQAADAVTDLAFSDALPAGLVFADPASPTLSSGCDGATSVSAPAGGDTLTFTSPRLAAGETCTVRVDVTGDTAGVYTNTSGDLTSSGGNSGPATADLTIDAIRPGFSKEFSPDSVPPGGTTRLVFTFDYGIGNESTVFSLGFTDQLPGGLLVATTPNLTNSCGGLASASPGSTTISLTAGSTPPETPCEVAVDVVVTGGGTFVNRSGVATSSLGELGFAVDQVSAALSPLALSKQFQDPAAPGSTVDLVFTLANNTRDTVTDVTFTDDLDATLPGLQAAGSFPLQPCGAGSSIGGTSTLTFTGGTLAGGASCTFAVPVEVPAGAATGAYLNVTSDVDAQVAGVPTTFGPAADTLDVAYVPILSKQFCVDASDPCVDVDRVEGGELLSLVFTIVNTDPTNPLTDVGFEDDLGAFLPGATVASTTQVGICGAGSVLFENPTVGVDGVIFQGGSIGPDDSCTFSVDVQLPASIPPGTYLNQTTPVEGSIDGAQVVGSRGEDTLSRGTVPLFTKQFQDPVGAGDTVDLVFTFDAGETTADFTSIAFSDDLDATLSGLAVVSAPLSPCGGTLNLADNLSYSGGSVAAGATCSFTVTLQVPAAAAPGSYTNTTSDFTALADGEPVVGAPAVDDLDISFVSFQKGFIDDPAVPGGTVTLSFGIQNLGSETLSDLSFTDDLDAVIAGLVPTDTPQSDVCGPGSSLDFAGGTLTFTGGTVAAGGNCSFSTVLQVPAGTSAGEYTNVTSSLIGLVGVAPFAEAPAADSLSVEAPLSISKSFTDDPVGAGETVNLRFTIANTSSGQTATDVAFTDDLEATLSGLVVETLPAGGFCGVGSTATGSSELTVTGASVGPTSTCVFDVVLRVPTGASGEFLNETSELTAQLGGSPVSVPGASDTLRVVAVDFTKAFAGDAAAGGTVTLTFTIENLASGSALANLSFSDDLDAVIPGLVATGLPMSGVCGAGSTLSGTSTIQLTGGSVPAESSCTIPVTLSVPAGAAPGTYTNTSGPLMAGSFELAPPAEDDLTIVPPPGFAKEFQPAVIPETGISTLVFEIDNTAGSLAATDLDFTDDLPAGVVVAASPDASTTCTGGTLTAAAGSGTISYTGGSVAAGATCTVSVDVTSADAGNYDNVSGELTSSSGDSGTAGDTLSVVGGEFALSKTFTDPVLHGGAVDVQFTIVTSAAFGVGEISFTDDLGAVLPGLVAVGLPADGFCGPGSQMTGTTVLTVTGASVAAGSSCSFSAILSVPADAALGSYTNTTSAPSGVRSDDLPTSTDPATAPLEVVFLGFEKVFLDDEVSPGETITLRFTLTNPDDVNAVDDVTFTDDLAAALPGATALGLPEADVCGTGSILSGSSEITLTNGSLAAGGSCTFDVVVNTSPTTPEGTATNVTSPLSATVSGNAVSGDEGDVARADVEVVAPASVTAIPTLDFLGLLALVGALGVLGWFRLRG